jgi:hypothetical protein
MAELNFDLFEHYRSRAVKGDGEAARDLLRLFADRVSNPEQGPLQQREREVLAMILRRFADYSDDVDKEREDKQRRKWTPMRVFMEEADGKLLDAERGPMKLARKVEAAERHGEYIVAILAYLLEEQDKAHLRDLVLPESLRRGAANDIAAELTSVAEEAESDRKKRARKRGEPETTLKTGVSYKTIQNVYSDFKPTFAEFVTECDERADAERAGFMEWWNSVGAMNWWNGLTDEEKAEVVARFEQGQSGTK